MNMNVNQMARFTAEVTTSVTIVVIQVIILAVFELGMFLFQTNPRRS